MAKAKRKRDKGKIIAILIIIASLAVGFLAGYLLNMKSSTETAQQNNEDLPADLLSTEGFERVISIDIEPPTLMLFTKCSKLDMNITEDQLYSIGYALNNMSSPRPLTHDLLKNLIENYNIQVLQIKIDSTTPENIYKAKIIFRQENRVLVLDTRPSDATAISVRTGNDIWIKKDILDKFGMSIC